MEDESTQYNDIVRSASAESNEPLLTTGVAAYTISSHWEETRIDVSRMLGSIGAPPLTALTFMQHDDVDLSNANVDDPLYLDTTSQLSASHVNLIKTLGNALNILVSSTSLRLGLGVSHTENERAVFRAEKAWTERHLNKDNLNARGRCHPKLTLSRSRQILCQIMIDQAISLHAMLTFDVLEYKKWEEFIDDMKYCYQLNSSQNAPVLTLSKLSIWMNGLRSLLTCVLSQLLSKNAVKDVSHIKQSCQFVKERFEYLQFTFSLSAPTQVCRSFEAPQDDSQQLSHDESTIEAMKMTCQIQSTLEAAQLSLWAMRHSFFDDQSDSANSDDPKVWWSQLKDLLSDTESAMNHFKSKYLPDNEKDEMAKILDDDDQPTMNVHPNSTCIEIDDDAPEEHLRVCPQTLNSIHEHADKTWIFSASGTHRYKQGSRPLSARTGDFLQSTQAFGQTLLIRDLEKRLNTIQLAEEHDAVILDDYNGNVGDPKPSERKHVPFFMGVEGSLLSELSNALDASGVSDHNK
eukprot:scaffold28710_cov71-Cyclotella_meneghiniana.AAC.5